MPINPIAKPQTAVLAAISQPALEGNLAETLRAAIAKIEEIPRPGIVFNERIALIVAQVNYPRPKQSNEDPAKPGTYLTFARNYKDYLFSKDLADRVIIFELLAGRFVAFTKGGPKDGQPQQPKRDPIRPKNYRYNIGGTLKLTVTPKQKASEVRLYYSGVDELALSTTGKEDGEVSRADYDKWPGGKENSMSVADVYETVFHLPAGSLRELHFIGHGIADGPLLVNTPNYKRKQYDKDGRIDDFTDPELAHIFGQQPLPTFKAAFHTEAFTALWGCEARALARWLIFQAKHGKGKAIVPPRDQYGSDQAHKTDTQQLASSLGKETEKLKSMIAGTYASALAKASGRRVLAALPGMGSVHEDQTNTDKSGAKFEPTVMHVDLAMHLEQLQFYKELGIRFENVGAFKAINVIEAKFKGFGRGYAVF